MQVLQTGNIKIENAVLEMEVMALKPRVIRSNNAHFVSIKWEFRPIVRAPVTAEMSYSGNTQLLHPSYDAYNW